MNVCSHLSWRRLLAGLVGGGALGTLSGCTESDTGTDGDADAEGGPDTGSGSDADTASETGPEPPAAEDLDLQEANVVDV